MKKVKRGGGREKAGERHTHTQRNTEKGRGGHRKQDKEYDTKKSREGGLRKEEGERGNILRKWERNPVMKSLL